MIARRLPSLAVVAALAAATLPAAAHAQPECTTGTLAEYVALVDGCRLAGVTFSGFSGGYVNVKRPLEYVNVSPLLGNGIAGLLVRGGGRTGNASLLAAYTDVFAGVFGGTPVFEREESFELRFSTSGVGPGARLGFWPQALGQSYVVSHDPFDDALAASRVHAGAGYSVRAEQGGGVLLAERTLVGDGPAVDHCAVDGSKLVPCPGIYDTGYAGGPVRVDAFATATGAPRIDARGSLLWLGVFVTTPAATPGGPVAVVPEPRAAVLLATGLLGLGVARRRRGGVARPAGSA